ncbi:hypothetical protein IAR55_001327 [Kwoniella newhampshirensis]|uniref:Uncharacterized protein n=1 Tax=Kwoniella newhampshirensis TaxID=1651941 RepID=A0AAW0Z5B7_9TREE
MKFRLCERIDNSNTSALVTRDTATNTAEDSEQVEEPSTQESTSTTPTTPSPTPPLPPTAQSTARDSYPLTRALFQAIYSKGYADASTQYHQHQQQAPTLLEILAQHPIMTILALSTSGVFAIKAGKTFCPTGASSTGTRSLKSFYSTSRPKLASSEAGFNSSHGGINAGSAYLTEESRDEILAGLSKVYNKQQQLNQRFSKLETKLLNHSVDLKDVTNDTEKSQFNVGNIREPVGNPTSSELDMFVKGTFDKWKKRVTWTPPQDHFEDVEVADSKEPMEFDPEHHVTFSVDHPFPPRDGILKTVIMRECPVYDENGDFVGRKSTEMHEYEPADLTYENGVVTSILTRDYCVFGCTPTWNHEGDISQHKETYILGDLIAYIGPIDEDHQASEFDHENTKMSYMTPEQSFMRDMGRIRVSKPEIFGPCETINPIGLENILIDQPEGVEFYLDQRLSGEGTHGAQRWAVRLRGVDVDGKPHPLGSEVRGFETTVFFAYFPDRIDFGQINVDLTPSAHTSGAWIIRHHAKDKKANGEHGDQD